MKYLILISVIISSLFFSCSKKNNNPTPDNNSNGVVNTSDYGIFYTFKNIKYRMVIGCGIAGTNATMGFYVRYSDCDGIKPPNYFTEEKFRLYMFHDSISTMQMINKPIKQINGYILDEEYPLAKFCSGFNLELTLSNGSVLYSSRDCNKKDTIQNASTYFFNINSVKFKSQTYTKTTSLLSGKFNYLMVNDKDSTDTQIVSGYYNDIEYTFDRVKKIE